MTRMTLRKRTQKLKCTGLYIDPMVEKYIHPSVGENRCLGGDFIILEKKTDAAVSPVFHAHTFGDALKMCVIISEGLKKRCRVRRVEPDETNS